MSQEAQALKLVEKIDNLLDRVSYIIDDGDRAPIFLRGQMTFVTGETPSTDMIFNIPKDADFFGERLNLYLQRRVTSLTAPATATEKTFRPVCWTTVCDITSLNGAIKDATATFEITDSMNGPYASAPMSIKSAWSQRVGVPQAGPSISSYIGGLDFVVPYHIKRGHTLTVKVSPIFSRFNNETTKNEYRVVGVLTGYKKVKAFK